MALVITDALENAVDIFWDAFDKLHENVIAKKQDARNAVILVEALRMQEDVVDHLRRNSGVTLAFIDQLLNHIIDFLAADRGYIFRSSAYVQRIAELKYQICGYCREIG